MILKIRIFVNRKILILGIFLRKIPRIRLILKVRIFVNADPVLTAGSFSHESIEYSVLNMLLLIQHIFELVTRGAYLPLSSMLILSFKQVKKPICHEWLQLVYSVMR